jgi:hypothetical protein
LAPLKTTSFMGRHKQENTRMIMGQRSHLSGLGQGRRPPLSIKFKLDVGAQFSFLHLHTAHSGLLEPSHNPRASVGSSRALIARASYGMREAPSLKFVSRPTPILGH